MSDYIWFAVSGVLFALSGSVFVKLGWQIWKKQKTDLIITYHCERVSKENKQAYCTLLGIGVLIMGIGFFLSAICIAFKQSVFIFIPMTVGLVLGSALLTSAVIKYNR